VTVVWWVSCKLFTCIVECKSPEMIITGGAPIVRKYKGKTLEWLIVKFNIDRLSVLESI